MKRREGDENNKKEMKDKERRKRAEEKKDYIHLFKREVEMLKEETIKGRRKNRRNNNVKEISRRGYLS